MRIYRIKFRNKVYHVRTSSLVDEIINYLGTFGLKNISVNFIYPSNFLSKKKVISVAHGNKIRKKEIMFISRSTIKD